MKSFLVRLLLAAAITLAVLATVPFGHAQQADEDSTSAASHRQQESSQQSPNQDDARLPSAGDTQTQEALSFTGRVVKEEGRILLKDPVTKMNYQLDDQSKAKPFIGKQVKVTGKLDLNSNTIHVESIGPGL